MLEFDRWIETNKIMERKCFAIGKNSAISAHEISFRIADLIDDELVIVELIGDYIGEIEGALIQNTLMYGKTLIIIAGQGLELATQLYKAWYDFCEEKYDNAYLSPPIAHEFIKFKRQHEKNQLSLGRLIIILPEKYEGKIHERYTFTEEDKLNGGTAHIQPISRLGQTMSMQKLCFMHQMDLTTAQHHSTMEEMLNGDRMLTWTDLQYLLQGSVAKEAFISLSNQNRMTSEQLAFVIGAKYYSKIEQEKFQGIYPSIYHAVWLGGDYESRGYMFRGQRDSRWHQECSLLRSDEGGAPPSFARIAERLQYTQMFLDRLSEHESELSEADNTLTEADRLALAQHYGYPTPLLDYTRSLSIAAFFATGAGDESLICSNDVGVIYYIAPEDALAENVNKLRASDIDFAGATGLHFGQLTVIEPRLKDKDHRIARQKGVFITGFDSHDLQNASRGAIYFRQLKGVNYLDHTRGITKEHLLACDAKFTRLIQEVNPIPLKLSAILSDIKMPRAGIFGSIGLGLSGNKSKADEFLLLLESTIKEIEPGLWPEIRLIVDRHFKNIRNSAMTAKFAIHEQKGEIDSHEQKGEIDSYDRNPSILDDVDIALNELSEIAGFQPDEFRNYFQSYRPDEVYDKIHQEIIAPSTNAPIEGVVYAIGFFLVGLEILRSVPGSAACQYLFDALLMLKMSKEPLHVENQCQDLSNDVEGNCGIWPAAGFVDKQLS